MSNICLIVHGSEKFLDIVNELELNRISTKDLNLNKINNVSKIKILFANNLQIKEVKKHLTKNLPIILLSNNKDYIKKNNLTLLNFHVHLTLPIEIISFVEIINILSTKYNFFKKSKITIRNYEIDSNTKIIMNKGVKLKLTEKELELILALSSNNRSTKSDLLKNVWKHNLDLDSHAFETNLHRLRKKIYNSFKDKNFIIEKNSFYYLKN